MGIVVTQSGATDGNQSYSFTSYYAGGRYDWADGTDLPTTGTVVNFETVTGSYEGFQRLWDCDMDAVPSDASAAQSFTCHRFLPSTAGSTQDDLRFDQDVVPMLYTYQGG